MKNLLVLTITLLILASCAPVPPANSSGPGVETVVAETLQAMTAGAQPTAQFDGLPVSYQNISFHIPLELNASATPSMVTYAEYPYVNGGGGPMAAHVVFQFTNYPLEGVAQIMVFKSSEYAAYGSMVQDTVTTLLAGNDFSICKHDSSSGPFYVQLEPVSFQNGHGGRCLTEVSNGLGPISNEGLFYYYEGITSDGAYFVAAEFQVNASILVADGGNDSITPPSGVPFDWAQVNLDYTKYDFAKYKDAIAQKLNDTPTQGFTPSMIVLDKIIESILVTNP
jgi:hypothetical protein